MGIIRRVIRAVAIAPLLAATVTFSLPSHIIAVSDQAIVDLTNIERNERELPSLSWDASLASAAWLKGTDMCKEDYWAHTAPDGTTGWMFIEKSGYAFLNAGENLAKDFSDSQDIIDAWMSSPSHRDNILSENYLEIGVASVDCQFDGTATTIVVALYATAQ